MRKTIMTKRRIATGLLSGVCAYAVTLTAMGGFEAAEAVTLREVPSSICHAKNDNLGTGLENAGLLKNLSTSNVSIYCPVVSDNGQFASDVTALTVHGSEGTDGAYTAACSCYVDPMDCLCSATKGWTNDRGKVATGITLTEWAQGRGNEYRWLLHRLTPNSTLAGYIMTGP